MDDFRSFIVRELQRRQARNSAYTVSAFARDLKMSSQKLGQVIRGKTGLSPAAGRQVADALSLSEDERALFEALVDSNHARSAILKNQATERLQQVRTKLTYNDLTDEDFLSMAHWATWAAYILVETVDFKPDYQWIATRLQISATECVEIYNELFAKGFLRTEADGSWKQTGRKVGFQAPKSSDEIRGFYRQILSKAERTLDGEPVDTRYFHVSMMGLRASDMPEIQRRIDEFSLGLLEEFGTRSASERVYSIAVEAFPLDHTQRKDS